MSLMNVFIKNARITENQERVLCFELSVEYITNVY